MTQSDREEPTPDNFPQQVLTEIRELRQEVERFNDKFNNYQKAMQWVVQIAVTLLISATVALVVSALTFLLRQ